MQTVKLQFILTEKVNQGAQSEFATQVFKLMKNCYNGSGSGSAIEAFHNLIISPTVNPSLKSKIIEDNKNTDIEYPLAEFEPINVSYINGKDYSSVTVKWDCQIKLTSVIYTCIEILSDKTFVCYKEDVNEIVFIKEGNRNVKAFVFPG